MIAFLQFRQWNMGRSVRMLHVFREVKESTTFTVTDACMWRVYSDDNSGEVLCLSEFKQSQRFITVTLPVQLKPFVGIFRFECAHIGIGKGTQNHITAEYFCCQCGCCFCFRMKLLLMTNRCDKNRMWKALS